MTPEVWKKKEEEENRYFFSFLLSLFNNFFYISRFFKIFRTLHSYKINIRDSKYSIVVVEVWVQRIHYGPAIVHRDLWTLWGQ